MKVYITTTNYINNMIFIFGLDENSTPVYICVNDHKSYIHVKSRYNTKDKDVISGEKTEIANLLMGVGITMSEREKEKIKLFEKRITEIEGHESAEFRPESLIFYKISVLDHKELSLVKSTLAKNSFQIPDMCEMPIKFFNDLQIKMCQWIEIDMSIAKLQKFTDTLSKRKPIQIVTSSDAITGLNEEKIPPPMKFATIDGEMYSSRYDINGSKAHPSSLIDDDTLYCLSIVFTNSKEIEKSFCIFIGEDNFKVDNGEMIFVNNESELFAKFSELINEYDPDGINGYNIQGFDFEYMKTRSSMIDLPNFGRLRSSMIGINVDENQNFVSKSWEGAGGTHHSFTTPDCYGRIVVDTFNLVKPIKVSKGAPGALQSLKLNDVGKFLVNETKEDISYGETYLGYRSKEPGIMSRIASYCIQDSILCWKIFSKVKGDVYLREAASMFMQDMNDVLTTGQNKKIFNNFLHAGEIRNSFFNKASIKRDFRVKGGHVEEPQRGKKTNVICVDFASMYPTTQMAMNICLSTFCTRPPTGLTPEQYDKYVIEVEIEDVELLAGLEEFKSEFEILKINDPEYVEEFFTLRKIDKRYINSFLNMIREDEGLETKKMTKNLVVYFVKESVRKGIFPTILEELRKKRTGYKKQMKSETDPALYEILDQRQKLVKVVMNSIYGVLGSTKGPLSCIEASSTITFVGRQSIKKVRDFLVERGCNIVYGDTDSVMFQIPNYTEKPFDCEIDPDVEKFGHEISKEINAFLPKPMEVEFEKVMNMVPVKKKHYLGVKTWPDREVFIKGLAGIRGDSTPFAQAIFRNVVRMITENKDYMTIRTYVDDEMQKLKDNQIPRDMLVVGAMLAASYASPTAPMKVYSDYLKNNGYPAESGTKIFYLVTKQKGTKTKSETYRPENTTDDLDIDHYFQRASRSVEEIIKAAFNQ